MPTSNLIFTLKHSCKTISHIHQIHAQAIRAGLFSPLLTHILHSFPLSSPQQNANRSIIYFTKIFNLIPNPSHFNYTDIIRAHTFLRSPQTAMILFLEMRRRSIAPNFYTIYSVLKACELLRGSHSLAKALHAQVMKLGFWVDVFVRNTLSCTYCRFCDVDSAKGVFEEGSLFRDAVSYNIMIGGLFKAGEIGHARELFDQMPSSFRNAVSYNAMIDGFSKAGKIDHARELFDGMPSSLRNVVSYTAMIDGLSKAGMIDHARELFDEMPSSFRNGVSYNAMIDGLSKGGKIYDARELFDGMPSSLRNVVSYTAMIDGLSKAGMIDHARELFDEMPSSFRNGVTYTAMIDGLLKAGKIDHARELFDEMQSLFRNAVSYNAMIDGLSKAGKIDHARKLFDGMPSSFRDVMSYNAMIDGLAKAGKIDHARKLFDEIPSSFRNGVTYTAMIDGLFKAGKIDHARELFDEMPSSFRNAVSYNAMIDGLSKAGKIDHAREQFDEMPCSFRNAVSYTAMIDGFLKVGKINHARELFDEMPNSFRDAVSYNAMIDGLSKAGKIDHAKKLFDEMPISFRDAVSYTAMIDGLAKAGKIDHARKLFDEMPERNAVTWGALLAGYAKWNCTVEAIELFHNMMDLGVEIDGVSLVSLLSACAQLGKMVKGKEIHGYIVRNGIKLDAYIGTALVDLYAKSGCIEMAKAVFWSCQEKNVTLWSAMLKGLAIHGQGGSLLQYFSRMLEDEVKPNGVTTLAILFGCSHSGLINVAKRIFVEMESVYGVPREPHHYICMVDVLARGGLIKEAREMIEGMPMEADALMWKALLGGCRKHGDVEVAEEAAEHLMQITPEDGSVYSVMAVIYASIERWDDSVKMHCLRHGREVESIPGCSWIELDGITHEFFAGDRLCPEVTYWVLNGLQQHLQHS